MHSRTAAPEAAHPPAPWVLGPRTSVVLAASAAAASTYSLGAVWLGEFVLGLPVGAWMIAACGLAAHGWARRGSPVRDGGLMAALRSAARAERESLSAGAGVRAIAETADAVLTETRRGVERLGRRIGTRHSTLRIGLDLPEHARAALVAAWTERQIAGTPVELAPVRAGLVKDGPADCRAVDALLRAGSDGEIHLFVPTHPERPAAWPDWSAAAEPGYVQTFPCRLDTARAALGPCNLDDPGAASLVARLTLAAAVLGRSSARLPGPAGVAGLVGRTTLPNWATAVDTALTGVAEALLGIDPASAAARGVLRCAGRVVTAWLSTTGNETPAVDRLAFARTAARFCPSEPETDLRLGALEIAAGLHEQGLERLLAAARALRAGAASCETDPVPFLMSEAELGGDGLAVGRIAAGLALAWGTADPGSAAYLGDDLLDDLGHAPWLSQNPGNQALLERVLDALSGDPCDAQRGPLRRAA